MAGTLTGKGQEIYPHFWIDLPSGERIDYRATMWLGANNVPHGVFDPQEFPDVIYEGDMIELEPLPDVVFQILTRQIDYEKLKSI